MYAVEQKIRQLFDKSMSGQGGSLRRFRENFEQSLGVETDLTGRRRFNPQSKTRAIDHNNLNVGEALSALLGPGWRNTFSQHFVEGSQVRQAHRYEGWGSATLSGDIAAVSGALDVIAGMATARLLELPMRPEFIGEEFVEVVSNPGYEGGFDARTRTRGDKPRIDQADSDPPETVKQTTQKVHRNRSAKQSKRAAINKWTVLNDLTGSIYDSVDEEGLLVLAERETKIADCVMGIGKTATLADFTKMTLDQIRSAGNPIPMSQDGLTFYPYQNGIYGDNAGKAAPAPDNSKLIQNFANANDGNGVGLTTQDQVFGLALQIMAANLDPFTGLPTPAGLDGMLCFGSPRTVETQLKVLLEQYYLSQINGASGVNTNLAQLVTSQFNMLEKLKLQIKTSQLWINRLTDVGVLKVDHTGTATASGAFTNAAADTYATAGSVASFMLLGHFKKAVKYLERQPYTVQDVPLGPQEWGEETVSITDIRERGQAYWANPRPVFRQYC